MLVGMTVATAVGALLQLPPVVASANVVEVPAHMLISPVIGKGATLTVMFFVTVQPIPTE
jgi:hypothetical protein